VAGVDRDGEAGRAKHSRKGRFAPILSRSGPRCRPAARLWGVQCSIGVSDMPVWPRVHLARDVSVGVRSIPSISINGSTTVEL
jgi:hypothetical protein